MNFCERCNIACDGERCPKCGQKRLRAVTEADFCLIAQVDRGVGGRLKDILEKEGIECVLLPYGTGVHTKFALPPERYLLYVRYQDSDRVRGILKDANF